MKHSFLQGILTPAISITLSACSVTPDVEKDSTGSAQQQEFSAEDKRVARMLSIGGEDTRSDATPQYRAALCSVALAAIEDRMLDSGVLATEEQRRAFQLAQDIYIRRAAAGLSREQQDHTRSTIEDAYPEESDRARFAIGCLRELA